MSSSFKGITLHEGYNNIGSFEVNITEIEQPAIAISYTPVEFPPLSRELLFKLNFENGQPIPENYKTVLTASVIETETYEYTSYTNAEGYIQIDTPRFPISLIENDPELQPKMIRLSVNGPLNERAEECYLKVYDTSLSASVYTLITDLCVAEDAFGNKSLYVFDGVETYYEVQPALAIEAETKALYISAKGAVYEIADGGTWTYIDTLTFRQIEFPDKLEAVADGFYRETIDSGTISDGHLGEAPGPFAEYSATLDNPDLYLINVNLELYNPIDSGAIYTHLFQNLLPGTLNFKPVIIDAEPFSPADESPTIEEIQTISGITFSELFTDFLESKELTSIERIRKAGPIVYINDYPVDGVGSNELDTLQAHVDFYSINKNASQNQRLISEGFKTVLSIAYVQRKTFLDSVVNESLPLFQAAKIYELAVQNQKLTASLIPGIINDLRLEHSTTPAVPDSNFVEMALANVLNSCGCDDCKSVISPFAYLLDLLKYGAGHVEHTSSPVYHPGGNVGNFVSLVESKFRQPFGNLKIDCKTLHDEFCRVRLVSEVLESVVASGIAPARATALTGERNQFFLLVYQTILLQAGSSVNEVRNVYLMKPAAAKLAAAQKLSDKLGIPLYISPTTNYTVDALWLTIGNSVSSNNLNAANLESVFGFRNTQRNVISATPASLMELWHSKYLRDFWKTQDYFLSAYSRENLIVGNTSTYKPNWKPILDPDLIGWDDFTYNTSSNMVSIWQNRKVDTDAFLQYCLTAGNGTTSVTSVDMTKRILRIPGIDLTSQTIENNTVSIYDTPTTLVAFKALEFKVLDTNTDVYLDQAISPAIFQPDVNNTVMHYRNILQLPKTYVTGAGTTTIIITFPEPVLTNPFTNGYARFQSVNGSTVTAYEKDGLVNEIINAVFDIDMKQVILTVNNNGIDAAFLDETLSFIYEAEVPLYTTEIINPELVVTELFTHNQSYNKLTSPSASSPVPYTVWTEPLSWPVFITAPTDYSKLKQMYGYLSVGTYTEEITELLTDNLFMTKADFNRMMDLLHKAEFYLKAMYTETRPTVEELYELASIFRNSAKTVLRLDWLKEEIEYQVTPGNYLKTMLNGKYFWKSLTEPSTGSWDPSLQKSPLIDPELFPYDAIVVHPEADPYRTLYTYRIGALSGMKGNFQSELDASVSNGFSRILNWINFGNPSAPYNILPYTTLEELMDDLDSLDAFKQKLATDTIWNAFTITPENFRMVFSVKTGFEGNDPLKAPTPIQIDGVLNILVSAYKRKQFYATWSALETSVLYYNVFPLRLATGRADVENRREWQRTLEAWNRQAIIQPDLVPPENIKNFVPGNPVYTTWNARKTAINTIYTTIATAFAPGLNAGVLLTELENQVNLVIARVDGFTTVGNYFPYFLKIKTIEERGDDIRPNLAQLGITTAEYRVLRNIYDILVAETSSSPSSLTASECKDVADILTHIRAVNLSFNWVEEDYKANIILSQDKFLNYKPALINFPLSDLPTYNPWRSPAQDRKVWKDTLEGRIEMEQGVVDRWKEVLKETEDRNMPLMRDALIRALTADCQSWQDKAESLAKTYFIETKDNCCVKHTRVSFAIETMQGFLTALQNGIYDGFISNFKLYAPAFIKEWEWLGSYATWRAAIFVYMYPENLLYPTLKKQQSPAFIKLAQTVQNANRFNPEDACKAADEYNIYLEDLKDLNIICTVNGRAKISPQNENTCCTNPPLGMPVMSFFFAQGKSGASYWSYKDIADTSAQAHSFWYELPVRKDAKPIGCFYFGTRGEPGWIPLDMYLVFFYSYSDKGSFKIAYIKKKVYEADSNWSEETDTDEIPDIDSNKIKQVTACQNAIDWDVPNFSVYYQEDGYAVETIRWFNPLTDKWQTPTYNNTVNSIMPFLTPPTTTATGYSLQLPKSEEPPFTCIRYAIVNSTQGLRAYAHIFKNKIIIRVYGANAATNMPSINTYDNILGAFETQKLDNTITVLYRENGIVKGVNFTVTCSPASGSLIPATIQTIHLTYTNMVINEISKVHPVFSENGSHIPRLYAFSLRSDNERLSGKISQNLTQISLGSGFALTPSKIADIPLQSAECIPDMNARKNNVQAQIVGNTVSSPAILRTTAVKEVLYEAYYFVPMLLALDQQKRGEYTTALNWYRSVYDYTLSATYLRKIFYGLKLEESITNVYTQAPNWLLDPLNPHLVAQSRANAYTKYTIVNIVQCLFAYADREFTIDTIESVPVARRIYTEALELLKVRELNRRPNACDEVSTCVTTKVNIPAGGEWSNALTIVKTKLTKLGKASLIESIEPDIVDLLNSATEDTYAEKFADVFQLIDDTVPLPSTPKSMTEGILDFAKHTNFAYSYLHALSDHSDFNARVENNFSDMVTSVSGISKEELNTPDGDQRMAWLSEAIPDNSEAYSFRFANEEGMQQLRGDDRYDPVSPDIKSRNANLVYSNATRVTVHINGPMPEVYVPLIDYGFCMPKNPVYDSLILKGNVELYKIFNCRNIAGMVRELDPYAAATDSVTGMPFIGASGNLVTPGIGNFTPSQYRFRTLMERAKQIVAQAQQMESLFLSALEKEDAENYSQLRAKQDLQTAKATVKLQNLRITQAVDEQRIAQIQLEKATFTQEHYDNLLAAGQNAYEIVSLILLQTSVIFQGIAAADNFYMFEYGQGFSNIASGLSTQSSIFSQLASFQRRAEEWGFQKDLAGFDISLANQQIKVAEDNIRVVTQERDIAQMNTDHAQDSLEFLKTKFTNAELYNYMGNVLERSYSYLLNLGTAVARTAERQLYFERQEQAGPFILDDYWETPSAGSIAGSGGSTDRRGLTGSARLLVDITRLDQYAFDTNKRKLQLSKVISLSQNFPAEFQKFKETGVLNFALTNKMFDYDFPGQYLRLINSVKTTVVGLLPVYDGIKATLTAGATSYTVIGGTIFQRTPIRRSSSDSVALTSPNNATGLFELQPAQNELLNPFENMGIESQWEFKMPKFSNHIDYSNIADILLTVEYTALDSFEYRTQVLQDLDNSLSFNRGFSLKNNFPDQWYELADVQQGAPGSYFSVTIELKREMFPQGISNLKLNQATGVLLYFVREDGYTNEIAVADFNLANSSGAGPSGDTVNGIFRASATVNSSPSPLLKLRLSFANTAINRRLFSEGNVTDIMLMVGCKAELNTYPL